MLLTQPLFQMSIIITAAKLQAVLAHPTALLELVLLLTRSCPPLPSVNLSPPLPAFACACYRETRCAYVNITLTLHLGMSKHACDMTQRKMTVWNTSLQRPEGCTKQGRHRGRRMTGVLTSTMQEGRGKEQRWGEGMMKERKKCLCERGVEAVWRVTEKTWGGEGVGWEKQSEECFPQ